MSDLIRRASRRLLRTFARDAQTYTLLSAGARGAERAAPGVLTAWDWWTASRARRRGLGGDAPPAYPQVGIDDDPITAIVSAPEFAALSTYFNAPDAAERALVSSDTQALLYALVRNQRPDCVIEIGTYRASTSKAICRALSANGHGQLRTIDPFNSSPIMRLVRRWPSELRDRMCYYPMSSMDFFEIAFYEGLKSELIFVDGNHDYEYALFDIQTAARLLRPRGFIAIDNISQAGPFHAARDFLKQHPSWRECGHALDTEKGAKGFDLDRSTIANTDLCIIRAPSHQVIGRRPATQGQQRVENAEIGGVGLSITRRATGALSAQYVIRVREPVMSELATETQVELCDAAGPTRVPLPWKFAAAEVPLVRTVELWLSWSGDDELKLSEPPTFF